MTHRIIGEDANKTYSTFDVATDEEKSDIEVLKMKFEALYKPALNLAYHEFLFGKRDQKDGENFNDWLTDLRILEKCLVWTTGRAYANKPYYSWN